MDLPKTTKAVRVFEHGGTEKLIYDEYPLPELGERDVLVKVHAAPVSGWDVKFRLGEGTDTRPDRYHLPQQLGREAAGEVVAVGTAVRGLKPGDRVLGAVRPERPEAGGAAARGGGWAGSGGTPGHDAPGGYAEYLVRGEQMWFPLRPEVDLEQAAVTLWAFSSAHRVVVGRLRVQMGDTVLVTGASGGMGQATMQLAKLAGARVVATTRHQAKVAALRDSGADEVVATDDLERARAEVRAFTDGEGVDHVVDYTDNHDLLRFCVGVLRQRGQVLVAAEHGDLTPLPFTSSDFLRMELTVLGLLGAGAVDTRVALQLLARGRIHTRIAARFPLAEVRAAHQLFETSQDLVGRIVLQPHPG